MELLGPELGQVMQAIADPPSRDSSYLIELPDAYTVDLPLEELSSLVARTSNAYGRVARLAGMARAEAKIAKGRYERKYKKSRSGNNEAERNRKAMELASDEHIALTNAEAIAELADAMEAAARVASESIRKIFDKAGNMVMAQQREAKGKYREADFSTY